MDAESLSLFEDSLRRYNGARLAAAHTVDNAGRWRELQAMGWFELLRPEDEQQVLAPLADLLPLFIAAGEAQWSEPIANVFGEPAAIVAATDEASRRRALLEGLISGERPLGYAHREPGDGWSNRIATQARRTAGGDRLDGRKAMVVGADTCAAFLVTAIDSASDSSAVFLVDAAAPGLVEQRYRTIDGRVAADLEFSDTPAERLCAGEAAIRDAQVRGALLAAAESVGIMRGASRDTTEYLRERKQFGQALLGFQALQHRLVEMRMREHESSALLQAVAEAHDQRSTSLPRQLLALRVQVARALRLVTREAIQLHGGMGVTEELRIGRWYRRGLMLDSLHGTAEAALDALSQHP